MKSEQSLGKPHITKLKNSINLSFQYRCKGGGIEIYGSSPEDAYVAWKRILENTFRMNREWLMLVDKVRRDRGEIKWE